MTGLLEKDFRLTLSRKQTLLIFLIMALFMGISMDGSFIIGYLTMLATIVAVGTISYDEYDNGFAFLMTLPFDRKTYVIEKYLFCLIMAAGAWCVGVLMDGIGKLIQHKALTLSSEFPMLLALIPVLYLTVAVMIPLQLKYGSEKSRIALYIIFGFVAVLIVGAENILNSSSDLFSGLAKTLENISPTVVLLSLTAVCALAACASCLWSIRIMEKKEF